MHRTPQRLLGAALTLLLAAAMPRAGAVTPLTLAQSPAVSGSQSVSPNLIYLLDDSGSMQWEWLGGAMQNLTQNPPPFISVDLGGAVLGLLGLSSIHIPLLPYGGTLGYTYGYPIGNSVPYGAGSYDDALPDFGTSMVGLPLDQSGTANLFADSFRSAFTNPIYYNPAVRYVPWACAAPYPESATQTSGISAPQTGLDCHWDDKTQLWVMADADPDHALMNPAGSQSNFRDLTVFNDSNNSNNNTPSNGYAGGTPVGADVSLRCSSSGLGTVSIGCTLNAVAGVSLSQLQRVNGLSYTITVPVQLNLLGLVTVTIPIYIYNWPYQPPALIDALNGSALSTLSGLLLSPIFHSSGLISLHVELFGFWPATYFNYFGPRPGTTADYANTANYQRVQICPASTTTNSNGVTSADTCTPPPALPANPLPWHTYVDGSGNYVFIQSDGSQISRSPQDELQNFADWYQYDRSRISLARSGTSQAFMKLPNNYRVDFTTINIAPNNGNNVGSMNYSTTEDFDTAARGNFLSRVYQRPIGQNGTPSRLALSSIGNYLAAGPNASAPWGTSAAEKQASGDNYLACRANYVVFVTDGAWNDNGPSPSVGNADNTAGDVITDGAGQSYQYSPAPPYQDVYGNTLADVAMAYWKKDLQPNLSNDVPTNSDDPAFWQHMTTFAVGLGMQGVLNDPGDLAGLQSGSVQWPDPDVQNPGDDSNPARVDDLWHAGIDGHGGYLSATDPVSFAESLERTLTNIVNRTESASSAALNAQKAGEVRTGTQVFLALYHPSGWWGELQAKPLLVGGDGLLQISPDATWDGACVLTGGACPAMGTDAAGNALNSVSVQAPSARNILTWNGSQGVAFQWADLSNAEQIALNDGDGLGATRLAYLRGTRSAEQAAGGALRTRSNVLGDIVDSSPVWVGAPDSGFPDTWVDALHSSASLPENASTAPSYSSFESTEASRTQMVYVGGNDGLLHGFRAGHDDSSGSFQSSDNDGRELLAFAPQAIFDDIAQYTSPDYQHHYFVDATPASGDLFYGGAWHSWLVGGEGAGGQSIYALDVTHPSQFSEANAASLVVKELNPATITCANLANCGNDLGYTFGTPIIRRLHNGAWAVIFGNGYNSANGDAVLFIASIDPDSGAWTIYALDTGVGPADDPTGAQRPDGIAYATSADLDGDHITDYIYAGDLFGNLWRFDLTSSNPADWKVSTFGSGAAHPLFSATSSAGTAQPITTAPVVLSVPAASGSPRVEILFGTGKNLEPSDQSPGTVVQSLYGIWDYNLAAWNSASPTHYATLGAPQTINRSVLQAQSVTGTYAEDGSAYSGVGTGYRTVSDTSICWQGACAAGNGRYGWVLDLPATGEQVIYNPIETFGVFVVNTSIPAVNARLTCNAAPPSGWTLAIDPANGGALPGSFLPNGGSQFDTINGQPISGVALSAVGTPGVITYDHQPYLVSQTVDGFGVIKPVNPPAGAVGSRQTWIELR
jgi:Tfp pilus assembly protein, tip-associated adhesin PilY1